MRGQSLQRCVCKPRSTEDVQQPLEAGAGSGTGSLSEPQEESCPRLSLIVRLLVFRTGLVIVNAEEDGSEMENTKKITEEMPPERTEWFSLGLQPPQAFHAPPWCDLAWCLVGTLARSEAGPLGRWGAAVWTPKTGAKAGLAELSWC